MAEQIDPTTPASPFGTEPAVIVSCDSHVGPLLREQLRDYCPSEHLEEFDAYVAEQEAASSPTRDSIGRERPAPLAEHPNLAVPGHHDAAARLADMDADGVAAEVIWHFSQNGENMPWVGQGLGTVMKRQFEIGKVGYHIYNAWLADFCRAAPDRLLGLMYLPMWDIDAAIAELQWCREAGLRGVNFPPPSKPGQLEYNRPEWEPFWSACEDHDVWFSTHSSGAAPFDYLSGPGGFDIMIYESGGWLARRAAWWLTHGLVFEHHPKLKLVITEQYEGWYLPTMRELDSVYMTFGMMSGLPRLPSEYLRSNVFLGASFPSPWLTEDAAAEGYAENVLWGRDYPHVEGVWQKLADETAEPVTKVSLRHVLHRIPLDDALGIAGRNAVRVLGLDGDALARIAAEIGAPTGEELMRPPDGLPEISPRSNAFKGQAGPRPLEPERMVARH